MHLVIDPRGVVHCLYDETIGLSVLGRLTNRRASRVEPDARGRWWALLTPVGRPCLGPFGRRSEALAPERARLEASRLPAGR